MRRISADVKKLYIMMTKKGYEAFKFS